MVVNSLGGTLSRKLASQKGRFTPYSYKTGMSLSQAARPTSLWAFHRIILSCKIEWPTCRPMEQGKYMRGVLKKSSTKASW
jgi:hypothetical protein